MAATGRVNVFSRVRPGVAREDGDAHCVSMNQDTNRCVVRLQDGDAVERVLAGGSAQVKTIEKEYTFDGVFDPESTQKDVYEEVGKPVLKDVLMGYNGSILAYGQTGAGKTHSLLNSGMGIDGKADPKQAGLLPRLVAALFVHIGADVAHVYSVEASMLQIYNENIDCLLGADRERAQGLQVTGKSEVRGLTWMPCKTPTDLLQCFQKGRNNLVYAETKMNKASSRSHAVFQIKVAKRPRASDAAAAKKGAKKVEMKAVFGKLTVVDLAGSERIKKSGVVGQQLREATNINSSLLAFGNIVQALAEKKNFIPYRDSKLTRILEDSVGGNCKTSLLVCCSPSAESADETVSTLEFASRAARIEITATINEGVVSVDAASLVTDLAGDGLDIALKEKQTQMNALECKLKKAATDAQDKQKAEAAKATEAKTQMDEWKKKAEEAAKKITSLEHAVKEAAEAKEAKAAVARAEATVAELRATLAKERAEAAKSADAMASDLKQQVYSTRKMLEESNARVLSLETRTQEADELVEELGRQLEASAGALSKAAHEASIAAEKASKEKAHALLLAEEEAVRRCNAAAAAAAEAAREETREQLVAEWSKKLADATTFAADEMQAVKESLEAEMHDVKRALEADVAERDARVAARDADVASLTRAASEQTTRVAALEEEAMSLHAEIQNARADVVAQREAAAEESKRMDAAHAAAVRVLNERRREEAAAAETRAREMEASHENEKRALEARSELKGKRLSWAFSASRAIMNETNEALKTEHDEMKRKFDNRESRDDDLRVISSLKQEVTILQSMCVRLESNAKQMSLQLDNRNTNDYVFGSASKAGRPRTVTGERAGYLYKPVSPPGETRPHTVNPHAPAGHRKLVGSASASVKKRRGERGAAFGESPLASQTVPAMGTGGGGNRKLDSAASLMRRRFPYVAAIAKSEQSSATTPPIVKSSVSFHPRDTLGVKVKTAWMRESDFGAEGPPQNTRYQFSRLNAPLPRGLR